MRRTMRRHSSLRRAAPLLVALGLTWLLGASFVLAADGGWSKVEVPVAGGPSSVNGVTWAAGTFVAVGRDRDPSQPAVWLSPDGSAWSRVTDITEETEPSVMRGVAPAAPAFLAVGSVGDDAAMWSSNADATGWRRVLVASFLGAEMHAVESTWAGTIAVGFDSDTQSAGIWREVDAQWSQVPNSPELEGIRLLGIETGSFDIIAVGEDVRDGSAAALISEDGVTWTRLQELEVGPRRLRDALWGPFTIVGAQLDPDDPDGPSELITYDVSGGQSDEWRAADVPFRRGAELMALAFSGQGDIAVGFVPASDEAIVYESRGAQTWEAVPDATGVFARAGMSDVERGGAASGTLVAVGWSGTGTGDDADARAAIWTTGAATARGFVDAVASPLDVSVDPVVVATGVAVAAGVTLLIPFPGALFNSTLEANYAEVSGWFVRPRRWLGGFVRRVTRRDAGGGDFWQRPAGIVTFLVLSAVLYALLDPTLGIDLHSIALVAGLLLGLVATTFAFALPTLVFHRIRAGELGRVRVLPGTIVIAVVCVLLSRGTGFQPGYMYGLLIGVTFARDLSVDDEGRSTAIATAWMLAVSIVAWVALIPARDAVAADPGALVPAIAQAALSTIVVAGLEGVVFGLLPVRFMPGAAIYAWSRRWWALLFALGLFGLLHVLINPTSGYLADSSRTPLVTIVILFAAFGIVSVGLWAYFRFRPPRADEAASA